MMFGYIYISIYIELIYGFEAPKPRTGIVA